MYDIDIIGIDKVDLKPLKYPEQYFNNNSSNFTILVTNPDFYYDLNRQNQLIQNYFNKLENKSFLVCIDALLEKKLDNNIKTLKEKVIEITSLFSNFSFNFTKIPENKTRSINNIIYFCGGKSDNADISQITHLVCGQAGTKDYQAVMDYNMLQLGKKRIVIIKPKWIFDCFRTGKLFNLNLYIVPIFHNCKICVSGELIDIRKRKEIEKLVSVNGGLYSPDLTKDFTHLIYEAPKSEKTRSEKYKYAKSWKIIIVRLDWLYDSIKSERCLPETSYKINDIQNGKDNHKQPNVKLHENLERNIVSSISHSDDFASFLKMKIIYDPKHDNYLENCIVSMVGFTEDVLKQAISIIRVAGGTRVELIPAIVGEITHFIMPSIEYFHSLQLLDHGIKLNKVCNISWLIECYKSQKNLAVRNEFCIDHVPRKSNSISTLFHTPKVDISSESSSLFHGFTFLCLDLSNKNYIEKIIFNNQGSLIPINNQNPQYINNHSDFFIVCEFLQQFIDFMKDEKYSLNSISQLKHYLITPYFIYLCINNSMLLNPRGNILFLPIPDHQNITQACISSFQEVKATTSLFSTEENERIIYLLEKCAGSEYCMSLKKNCNILISKYFNESDKIANANKRKIPIVSPFWLYDSLLDGELKPRNLYSASEKDITFQSFNPTTTIDQEENLNIRAIAKTKLNHPDSFKNAFQHILFNDNMENQVANPISNSSKTEPTHIIDEKDENDINEEKKIVISKNSTFSDQSKVQIISNPCIVLSGITQKSTLNSYRKTIETMGGRVLDDTELFESCDFVIASELKRVEKILLALILKKPILKEEYIKDSFACGKFIFYTPYLWTEMKSPESKTRSRKVTPALQTSGVCDILKAAKRHFSSTSKCFSDWLVFALKDKDSQRQESMINFLKFGGANVITIENEKDTEAIFSKYLKNQDLSSNSLVFLMMDDDKSTLITKCQNYNKKNKSSSHIKCIKNDLITDFIIYGDYVKIDDYLHKIPKPKRRKTN